LNTNHSGYPGVDVIDSLHDSEIELFRAMNLAGTNTVLDAMMVFFTLLGISYVIVLVSVPLWLANRRDSAIDIVMLVILVTILAESVKLLVDRPRPFEELADVNTILTASGPSFPSAHASRAFAIATLLWLRAPRGIGISAVIVAMLIAVSRVYLGVHWPTDVLGGAVLGIVTAYAFERMTHIWTTYRHARFRMISALSRGKT